MQVIRFHYVTLIVGLMLACGTALAADPADVVRLSEPVEADGVSETFGAPLDNSLPSMRLAALVAAADDWVGKRVLIDARVSEVCQKKGCFFIATDGAATVRVSFRDYSFFVPTDSGGKSVTLAGELVRVDRSADEAEHFADDLGNPGGIETGPAYEIVATSVRIPRG